jgi:hypothetical protein
MAKPGTLITKVKKLPTYHSSKKQQVVNKEYKENRETTFPFGNITAPNGTKQLRLTHYVRFTYQETTKGQPRDHAAPHN